MQTTTTTYEIDYKEKVESLGIGIPIPSNLDYAKAYQAFHLIISKQGPFRFYICFPWQLALFCTEPPSEQDWAVLVEEKAEDNLGANIAHYAAWSGSLDALMWIEANKPELFYSLDKLQRSIAHYAAWSGLQSIFAWVKEKIGRKVWAIDYHGKTVAHYAAQAASPAALQYIYAQNHQEIHRLTYDQVNVAHYAAWYGNVAALDWMNPDLFALFYRKDKLGKQITHYAAAGGSIDVLMWIRNFDRSLLYSRDNCNYTLVQWARWHDSTYQVLEWLAADPVLCDLLLEKLDKNQKESKISLCVSRLEQAKMAEIFVSTLTHFEPVEGENTDRKQNASPLESAMENISWEVLLLAFQNVKATYKKAVWGIYINLGADFMERYQEIVRAKEGGATVWKALFLFLEGPGNTNENSLKGLVVRQLAAEEEIWVQYPKGRVGELIEAMQIMLSPKEDVEESSTIEEDDTLFGL